MQHHEVERLVLVVQVADGLEDLLVGVEVEVIGARMICWTVESVVRVAEDAAEHAAFGFRIVRRQAVGVMDRT